jgi:hypothetical protein
MKTTPMKTLAPRLRLVQRGGLVVAAGACAALVLIACTLAARHREATAIAANEENVAPSTPPVVLTHERDSFSSAKSGDPMAQGRAESQAEDPTLEIDDDPAAAKATVKKSARPKTVWSSIKRFFSKRGS